MPRVPKAGWRERFVGEKRCQETMTLSGRMTLSSRRFAWPKSSAFRRCAGGGEVVAVDHFVVGAVAQGRGDLVGLKAHDPQDFVGCVVGQAANSSPA